MIDLRSDTLTQPTEGMRLAIASAAVGDNCYREDPTVQALEETTAEILGKEAALYMPSGTMSNQVAIHMHTNPGDEIVVGESCHLYMYEGGGPAVLSGVVCRELPSDGGMFAGADIRAAVRPNQVNYPQMKLVCVENTTNQGGGRVWPLTQLEEVVDTCRELGVATHMDGARIWNAAVAGGTTEAEIAAGFDSVSVCFSKGLGAPVGSALAGSRAFIERATRFRRICGGGMRQAGIIAAGALYALQNHRDRLQEDHTNARALAEGLATIAGIEIDVHTVETNLVFFEVTTMPASALEEKLAANDILISACSPTHLRAVTSLMVNADDIRTALDGIATALSRD